MSVATNPVDLTRTVQRSVVTAPLPVVPLLELTLKMTIFFQFSLFGSALTGKSLSMLLIWAVDQTVPVFCKRLHSLKCQMLLRGPTEVPPLLVFFSVLSAQSSCISFQADIVDLLGLNPCWFFGSRLFASRYSDS